MGKRLASIDLGSNTFHILIVEVMDSGAGFTPLHRVRDYVYLSKGGVESIDEDRYASGLQTLTKYKQLLEEYGVEQCRIIGTETLRIASNGADFVQEVKDVLNLEIEIIDGNQEAAYIHKGVKLFLGLVEKPTLIMDIGGGSVEFVIFDNNKVFWSHSFKIGISVLHNRFQRNDPMSPQELGLVNRHLDSALKVLQSKLHEFKIDVMVGSAGSFEIVKSMMEHRGTDKSEPISSRSFQKLYEEIILLDYDQRVNIPGLPIERVKLMPMALTLLKSILDLGFVKDIYCSPYSMKEGVIYEMMQA